MEFDSRHRARFAIVAPFRTTYCVNNVIKRKMSIHPCSWLRTNGINKLQLNWLKIIPNLGPSSLSWFLRITTEFFNELTTNVRTLKSNVKIAVTTTDMHPFTACTVSGAEFLGVQTQMTIIRPFDLKFLNCFSVQFSSVWFFCVLFLFCLCAQLQCGMVTRLWRLTVRAKRHTSHRSEIILMYLCAKIQ